MMSHAPKKRACVACHNSKTRCTYFSEGQTKCDRCQKTNRECVPHVSRQGQRSGGKKADGDAKAKTSRSRKKAVCLPVTGDVSTDASKNQPGLVGSGVYDGQDQLVDGLRGASNNNSSTVCTLELIDARADTGQVNEAEAASLPTAGNSATSKNQLDLVGVNGKEDQFVGGLTGTSTSSNTSFSLELIDARTDTVSSQVQRPPGAHAIVPVKQWIRQAVQAAARENSECVGALHLAYIKPCLKIAIALSKQIIKAEKLARCGINDQIDQFPIYGKVDWADHTMIRLKDENDNRADVECLQPLPYACGTNINGNGAVNTKTHAGNEQMKSFLKSCGINEFDRESTQDEDSNEALIEELDLFLNSPDLDKSVQDAAEDDDAYQSGEGQDIMPKNHGLSFPSGLAGAKSTAAYAPASLNASSSKESRLGDNKSIVTEDLNPLEVDSAEIKCPHDGWNVYKPTREDECDAKRIFYLGLLLYEMFSGGEKPRDLLALASSHGAFSSLSTMALLTDDTSNPNGQNEAKRLQGPSGTDKTVGLCKQAAEYLKHKGAPTPICELILNMLDCVYGDMCRAECYTSISDILFDLQLMLDKPKLLRGFNNRNDSSSQLDELSIPRDQELVDILSGYCRCLSGPSEVAIIKGEPGSGKSVLAYNAGNAIMLKGGIFLSAKFDQMQQSRPFSALASAFDHYCDILTSQLGTDHSDWADHVVNELRVGLGSGASYLSLVVPKISRILNISAVAPNFSQNFGTALERLYHMICQFIHIIAMTSPVSVTLFLDDLQWADEASISLLQRIIRQTRQKFFIIMSCRADEMNIAHPFWNMIESVRNNQGYNQVNVTTVELNCMDPCILQNVISDQLYLLPRLTKPLANIVYNKTKGNPLFVSQLMLSLTQDRLLWFDLKRQRWVWDQDRINDTKLHENVAACFIASMKELPIEVHLALNTLSMFGASATTNCMRVLETKLGMTIIEPLKKEKGLVSYSNDTFTFTHDKIQETCYSVIHVKDRVSNHLLYGQCLFRHAQEIKDDALLFTAINQINLGGTTAVTNEEDYGIMAHHNLTAGKKAAQIADFNLAHSLFQHGINFLQAQENYWTRNYDLSLKLHEAACQSSLASGKIQSAQFLSTEVFKNAQCFKDQLNTHFNVITLLSFTSVAESLERGLEILSLLGADIPSNPTEATLNQEMGQTVTMINSITVESLLHHKEMTDVRSLDVMRFLAKLQTTVFLANNILHSYIILKMVQLSISMGLAPVSPVVFATFGSMLVKTGNIQLGGRFVSLAKSLSDKMGTKDTVDEIIFHFATVQCYLQPIQAANESHNESTSSALSRGDITYACFSTLFSHKRNIKSCVSCSKR